MPDVVLIRPGCTDFDEQNRIQGTLDLPLSSRGEEQVREIVEELNDSDLEVIYTTLGEPARSTAAAIGASLGIPVKELDGLHNLDQGLWQGLLLDDVRRKYPKVFKQRLDSPETVCPPQGETLPEAAERIRKALRKPLKRKRQIGIVASEPLATLIGCVLRGCRPLQSVPICGSVDAQRIERLHTNGELDIKEPQTNGMMPQAIGSLAGSEFSRGGEGE